MNHLLIALGLLAAACVYPGGVALGAAAAACTLGFRANRGRWASGAGAEPPLAQIVPTLGAAILVVLGLPWPGNPLYQLLPLNLAGAEVGGAPLTMVGLLWLRPTAGQSAPRRPAIAYPAAICLLLLLLALSLRSPGWGGIAAAGGAGAEVGRLLTGVSVLLLLPLWGGSPAAVRGGLLWGSQVGLALFLLAPQAASWPIWLAILAWIAAGLAAGTAAARLGRLPLRGAMPAVARGAGRIWIP